ncbi:hypothetical protein ACRAWC_20655 [Leifsonia sp. L25]|uniref:hypothetical protein n=1 Tax=Leifsonia sp. L25 TaxID=3423957 RepID=UPI003D69CF12
MLIVLALAVVLPLLWILLTSFKTDGDAIRNLYSAFPNPFSTEALFDPRERAAAGVPLVPEQFWPRPRRRR